MSVNYDFVHRETRNYAFQDPELLLRMLADPTPVGRNTLARMWNALAAASGNETVVNGMQFATWERRWDDGTRVGIMKLPVAYEMNDAVMAAVVVRPGPRRFFFFRGPPEVRFFTLEATIRGEETSKPNDVFLCEWRLHGRRFEHALLNLEPPRADPDALNAAIKSVALHTPIALSVSHKRPPVPLTIRSGMLDGISGDVPLVKIAGVVPVGSEGNAVVAACFGKVSQAVDIGLSARKFVVYDMTDLRYDFGDHLGAFFWNLPALLDGVAIMVAVTGETRRNLESLQQFVGSWLPVGFYDSVHTISAHLRDTTETVQLLSAKRDACTQRGRVFKPGETGVKIVLLGSRQTGQQYRTRKKWREDCDLDCGVVGGPKELALLTIKITNQPDLIPNVQHPPIKTYSSVEEATSQGLHVIMPKPG